MTHCNMKQKLYCSQHLSFIVVNEADSLSCDFWSEELCEVEDSVGADTGGARRLFPEAIGHCSIACSDNQLGGAHRDQNRTQY